MRGYQSDFLGKGFEVSLPLLENRYKVLDYIHFSLIMDLNRKFPILTATNIEGSAFKAIRREDIFSGSGDKWQRDQRINDHAQWGMELYRAPKSDFDRGHMTKREDVQWGDTIEEAAEAARSTFYFTNAVPQHARVNQSVWRRIEDYILKSESVKGDFKINVFTGPVLNEGDPEFVTEVRDQKIRIPTLFWKMIYYINENGLLSRVAFLVGQKYLLEKDGIIKRRYQPRVKRLRFMNFKYADTYQVETPIVEELTGIPFPQASDALESDKPIKLIIEQVNVRGGDGQKQEETLVKGLTL